jgi:hypothetical protein
LVPCGARPGLPCYVRAYPFPSLQRREICVPAWHQLNNGTQRDATPSGLPAGMRRDQVPGAATARSREAADRRTRRSPPPAAPAPKTPARQLRVSGRLPPWTHCAGAPRLYPSAASEIRRRGDRCPRISVESGPGLNPLLARAPNPATIRNSNAALPCNSQNLPCNTQNPSLLLVLARTHSNPLKPLENLTDNRIGSPCNF